MTNYSDVYEHIVSKNYYDFKKAKTPAATISALLGDFIRNGDSRVKRIKETGGTFSYYLTKNESNLDIENIVTPTVQEKKKTPIIENYN